MASNNYDDEDIEDEDNVGQKESLRINNSDNNNKVPVLFRIHSYPALACNCTPSTITLMLSKLVSLASDHGFQLAMTMVGQQATSNTTTMSDDIHVRRNAGHVSNSND
eukprot:CAMPEP_0168190900 /NCGR_PEP_ID=MMETSP0139_2-20121125/17164_1 /TAXON_ID=44445 /ORGANISM="Pseudo-nitzschia australis, Strain 10249 10 AB" /LENGTH=107 /DNA_ID=CAMNT_0008113909 /DNA_START=388 /DNA_END=710 /DNA_ORIENTATION=-